MTPDEFVSFDEALAELQMATNELRSLVSQGVITPEGEGLELNFRLDQVLDLKKSLKDSGHPELRISQPEVAKGWSREDGLIVWRGSVPETGWVLLKMAPQDWDHMEFRVFFDARATLGKVGLAAGRRPFVAETRGEPAKWHSFLMEKRSGLARVVADDHELFSGPLAMPFLGLCGGGASKLSLTNQDTATFRGLKLERL